MYKNIKNVCLNPVAVPRVTGSNLKIFRCGQCVNCLRQKANELSVRAYREFQGQQVVFITFTYDNEFCPIQQTHMDINTATGEIIHQTSCVVRDKTFFDRADFTIEYNKRAHSRRFRPLIEIDELDALNYCSMNVSYPTIYYYDVKCLLKRFRQKFPKQLNHFVCVPEYGGLGYRPHYHFMAFGLSQSAVEFLVKDWCYGSVDVRYPNSSDSKEVSKISMYISKYCTKGKFDCPYIRQGYCQKPRRSVSENFGIGNDFEHLKSVVLASEQTNITDSFFQDDCPPEMNEYNLRLLCDRRKYNINGYWYPFPKYLLNKIMKKTIKVVDYDYLQYLYKTDITKYNELLKTYGKRFIIPKDDKAEGIPKKYKVVSSPLQNEITHYLLVNLVSDALREQRESYGCFKVNSVLVEGQTFEDWRLSVAREAAERQFISDMYNNSVF